MLPTAALKFVRNLPPGIQEILADVAKKAQDGHARVILAELWSTVGNDDPDDLAYRMPEKLFEIVRGYLSTASKDGLDELQESIAQYVTKRGPNLEQSLREGETHSLVRQIQDAIPLMYRVNVVGPASDGWEEARKRVRMVFDSDEKQALRAAVWMVAFKDYMRAFFAAIPDMINASLDILEDKTSTPDQRREAWVPLTTDGRDYMVRALYRYPIEYVYTRIFSKTLEAVIPDESPAVRQAEVHRLVRALIQRTGADWDKFLSCFKDISLNNISPWFLRLTDIFGRAQKVLRDPHASEESKNEQLSLVQSTVQRHFSNREPNPRYWKAPDDEAVARLKSILAAQTPSEILDALDALKPETDISLYTDRTKLLSAMHGFLSTTYRDLMDVAFMIEKHGCCWLGIIVEAYRETGPDEDEEQLQ